MDRSIQFEFAVYLLPASKGDPEKSFRDTVATDYPQLKIVEKIKQPNPESERTVSEFLQPDVQKKYAPPSLNTLRYAGAGLRQLVKVSESDVFDYTRTYPDHRQEGNKTGEVIKKMERNTMRRPIRFAKTERRMLPSVESLGVSRTESSGELSTSTD